MHAPLMIDTRESTEELLQEVERQLDAVDASLLEGDAPALEAACNGMRQVATGFSNVLESALSAEVFDAEFRDRIEGVAQRLRVLRAGIARRAAAVERSLAALLGTQDTPTYGAVGQRSMFGGAGLRTASATGMH
ncbi:hypothetical protein [Pseudacidovorax sp. RU35E]|uniref:hypothetical protein n=1 Tax=Pseudacidovorax sp. RU35E TaxID=1907403 RepID=UPI000954E497|nr:hypothetical protein [Pseudacidovorax sp. RU35E]SIQ14580.1 hypothetical protein SAMN05880557_102235 [Pseudacidovorax sp. RU35E]